MTLISMLQPYILFVTSSGSLICARVQYDSNKAILHPTLLPYRMIPSSQPSRKPNTKNFQSKKTTYYDIITIPATKIPKYYFLPSGRLPPSLPLSLPLSRTKDTPVDHHTSTTNETPPPFPPKLARPTSFKSASRGAPIPPVLYCTGWSSRYGTMVPVAQNVHL